MLNILHIKSILFSRSEKVGSGLDICMLCPGPTFSNLLQVLNIQFIFSKTLRVQTLMKKKSNKAQLNNTESNRSRLGPTARMTK